MQRRLCIMSEAKWSITEAKCLQISHNKFASQRDAISPSMGNLMLSHSAGMHNTDISIAGISKRFHVAPLHLFCIPAYTHQIPNGISSHLLRDNMYIISYAKQYRPTTPYCFIPRRWAIIFLSRLWCHRHSVHIFHGADNEHTVHRTNRLHFA